jgi:hypothetical protein
MTDQAIVNYANHAPGPSIAEIMLVLGLALPDFSDHDVFSPGFAKLLLT